MNAVQRYSRWPGFVIGTLCFIVGLAFTSWALHINDFDLGMQTRFAAMQLITILFPGFALSVWAARTPWFARLSAAYVCGLPVHLLGWFIGVTADVTALMWVMPVLIGAATWVFFWPRLVREFRGTRMRLPAWGSVALLVMWIGLTHRFSSFWVTYPAGERATALYADLYWHQGINASAQYRVPSRDPQAFMEGLNYHWLANAHVGALARGAGIEITHLTTMGWTVVAFVATIGLALGFASYLSRGIGAGVLAATMVVFTPMFALDRAISGGVTGNFIMLSPSHIFALPITVALIWLIVVLVQESRSRQLLVLPSFIALLLVCQGAKVSTLPVVLCGLLAALFFALVTRKRRALLMALTITGFGTLALTWPLFGGGGGGSAFELLATARDRPIYLASDDELAAHGWRGDLSLLLGFQVLLTLNHLWAAAAFAGFRWRQLTGWLLGGMIAAALGVTYVLDHPGQSQLYFAMGMQPVVAVVGAVGVVVLLRRAVRQGRPGVTRGLLIASCAAGGIVGALILHESRIDHLSLPMIALHLGIIGGAAALVFASATWLNRQLTFAVAACFVLAFSMGATVLQDAKLPTNRPLSASFVAAQNPPATADPYKLNADELAALSFIANSLPRDAMLATNVHCRSIVQAETCEQRGFWVAGLGQRQVLLGGWAYTNLGRSTQGQPPTEWHVLNPYPDQELFSLNESAFYDPTTEGLNQLRILGVTHLFADSRAGEVSPLLGELCDVAYANDTVTVCELRDS